MPLEHGKSKAAFGHNVGAEIKAGKPRAQALAIAYSVKRHNKKAHGGIMNEKLHAANSEHPKMLGPEHLVEMAMKKRMAAGGEIEGMNEEDAHDLEVWDEGSDDSLSLDEFAEGGEAEDPEMKKKARIRAILSGC